MGSKFGVILPEYIRFPPWEQKDALLNSRVTEGKMEIQHMLEVL